jgi:hypothetical protein
MWHPWSTHVFICPAISKEGVPSEFSDILGYSPHKLALFSDHALVFPLFSECVLFDITGLSQ